MAFRFGFRAPAAVSDSSTGSALTTHRAPRTARARSSRWLLASLVAGTAFLAVGCATVQDVTRLDNDLQRRMERTLDRRLDREIGASRAADQKRIQQLEATVATQTKGYTDIAERLAQSEARQAELAKILAERLQGLAADSSEMRRVAVRLDSEINRLPLETLEQLKAAIDSHLANRPTAPVGTDTNAVADASAPLTLSNDDLDGEWSDTPKVTEPATR